uniref:Putative the ring-variant domain is a c4hc3 zinc-finger like motif found in a number of cellular n=1 Tax=Culex tarsalis TaxID=7177 RepID=A0A1Q3FTC7_CULTA
MAYQQNNANLLSGIQAVRLFWSVHRERRRSSQLSVLTRSQTESYASAITSSSNTDFLEPQQEPPPDEDRKFCRICRHSDELLLENICECKGTMGQIHERCLRLWTIYQRSQVCEICRSKFRFNFDANKLSATKLMINFVQRRYFWVLLRDLLNFMVLFGVSVLQNANIMSMIQEEASAGKYHRALPAAILGACLYDLYFSRWVMNRTSRAYGMIREYWVLAHDDEFLGYFDPRYAVFGENQSEIENMLLAEYDAPDD